VRVLSPIHSAVAFVERDHDHLAGLFPRFSVLDVFPCTCFAIPVSFSASVSFVGIKFGSFLPYIFLSSMPKRAALYFFTWLHCKVAKLSKAALLFGRRTCNPGRCWGK